MAFFRRLWKNLWKDDEGQGLVEYGLILALIVIAIIVVLTTFGDDITAIFSKAKDSANAADTTM